MLLLQNPNVYMSIYPIFIDIFWLPKHILKMKTIFQFQVIWQGPLEDFIYVDESKYSLDDRISLPRKTQNDYSLRIENIKSVDQGAYKCSVGSDIKIITLQVMCK